MPKIIIMIMMACHHKKTFRFGKKVAAREIIQ
jgi:hypothetical protein